jgi:hypothetical protein
MLLKSKIIGILPLFLALILLLRCSPAWQDGVRISWLETTRYKLLLYNGPIIELFQNKKIEQSFTANYPGLSQVDILFRKNNNPADKQKIVFRLKNGCASEADLVALSTEIGVTTDLAFHSFKFKPLDHSAGQSYCIVLQAREVTEENALQVQLSSGDLYPAGQLQVYDPVEPKKDTSTIATAMAKANSDLIHKIYLPILIGKQEKTIYANDLGFQLHYQGLLMPTAQVFMTRLTANRSYLWGQSWFYSLLGSVYFILLIGLFYLARKTIRLE